MLQRNWDLPDSEPMEMAFPDYPVILYVEQTLRSPEMQLQIEAAFGEKVSLLRHNLS